MTDPSEERRRSLVKELIDENEDVVPNKEVVRERDDMVTSEFGEESHDWRKKNTTC